MNPNQYQLKKNPSHNRDGFFLNNILVNRLQA